MATSKTSSFWLTEEVVVEAGDAIQQATVDIGSLVDVGDQQAFSIEEVEYICQRKAGAIYDSKINDILPAEGSCTFQLSDLNPGTQVLAASDTNLISQGQLHVSTSWDGAAAMVNSNTFSHSTSFHPDTFGKLSEARNVVNDQMYALVDVSGNVLTSDLAVTFRIKGRIVKLSTKDWIALAVSSVAND
jgi:hypothetical protein